jgi:hypothetical protein
MFSKREFKDVFLPVLAMFVASRAALLLIGSMTKAYLLPNGAAIEPWTSLFCRFDCSWYLSIASSGYSTVDNAVQPGATNFAFYPLFPLLVRGVAPLFGGNELYGAIAVTNLCFLVALVYVYRYVRLLDFDTRTALLTVGLLCVLPQSIAFSAAYSESPFLLFLVTAMYYFRREQYLIAGIAAALLSATRANGIFFIVFAVAWIFQNGHARIFLRPWQAPEKFVPIVLAPLGFLLFLGYCFATTGDAFAHPSTELYGWGWHFLPPWENLLSLLRGKAALETAVSLVVFLCSFLLLRKRAYAEFAFCASLILLMWSGTGGKSVFRYWLTIFPIWISVADALASRPIWSAMTFSILSMINGMMMVAWTLQKPIAL